MSHTMEHQVPDGSQDADRGELRIDMDYVRAMLIAIGIDCSGPLKDSIVLSAFDILAACEIVNALPSGLDIPSALSHLETVKNDQPAPVRNAQQLVLDAVVAAGEISVEKAQIIREAIRA